MKCLKVISFILLMVFAFNSCKKDNIIANESAVWIKVLEDSTITSTDEEVHSGQNGKVITDADDNIFLYFYSKALQQTTVIRCSPEGTPVWRKIISGFAGMDIVRLNDGSIIVAGANPALANQELILHAFKINGSETTFNFAMAPANAIKRVENANMVVLPDNSIVISACTYIGIFVGLPKLYQYCFAKVSPAFTLEWTKAYPSFDQFPSSGIDGPYYTQNSIIAVSNNRFLFQYAVSSDPNLVTDGSYGLVTGILNDDVALDSQYVDIVQYDTSGTFAQSTGSYSGVQYRYTNGLLADGNGGFIFHYSCPRFIGSYPSIPAGFIRIDANATIYDTIPIPLASDYRVINCNLNQGRFLMTAYKSGVLSGTDNYNANRTIFLTGGMDLNTTKTFTFQNFYSDFFVSSAPTRDGGFIIFGKIQSFNGSSNKVALIKWRD